LLLDPHINFSGARIAYLVFLSLKECGNLNVSKINISFELNCWKKAEIKPINELEYQIFSPECSPFPIQ